MGTTNSNTPESTIDNSLTKNESVTENGGNAQVKKDVNANNNSFTNKEIVTSDEEKNKASKAGKNAKPAKQSSNDVLVAIYSGDNDPSIQLLAKKEKELEAFNSNYDVLEAAILEKKNAIKDAGEVALDGFNKKLSTLKIAKLRNELLNLKKNKGKLKKKISALHKEITVSYRGSAQKFQRSSIKTVSKKDSYHKQNSEAIKASISKYVDGMGDPRITKLRNELAQTSGVKADAIVMRTLVGAPRFLHAKVVSNASARAHYLDHFKNELGLVKSGKGKRTK